MKLVVTLLSIFSITAYAAANRKIDAGTVEFKQQATPSTPASGYNRVYAKPDGKVYNLTSAGVEAELGAGGGGGAKNYIQNPNAATDATTGVTYTNVTAGRDSSGGLFEDTNFSFTIDSATDVVSFAADAFDPYLQNTGLCQAEFTWTADANGENVQAQVFRNGAVIGQKNLYTTGATSPATASIAFLCGDLVNATTFRIVGTAATSTALKLSQVKLTEAQWSKDPVGGTFVGSVTWPGVSSCNWNQVPAVGTWSGFPVNSSCTFPTGSNVKGSGVTAPATKKPAVKILNAVAGQTYDIDVSGFFYNAASSQYCSYRLSNGTDHSLLINSFGSSNGTATAVPFMKGQITFSSSGDKEVEIQATAYNGTPTCYVYADGINTASLTFAVKSYPDNQAVVNLKAQSGDFGPTNFAMTITGTTSNPTKGANTEVAKYSRTASFMGINYSLNQTGAGASGSGCYLFSVPGGESVDTNQVFASTSSFNGVIGTAKISNSTGSAQRKFGTVHVYDATRLWVAIQTTATDVDCLGSSNAPLSDSAQLISFEVPRLPIKNWTKSNTAVNIAGEPGAYSAAHENNCLFARSNAALGDPTADGSCTFTEKQNGNFGTVTSALSGADKLPGIVHTPKLTGRYFVIATFPQYNASSANNDFSFTDGTNVIATGAQGLNSGSQTNMMTLSGVYSGVAGTPVTLKIQSAASAGTINIGSPGLSSGNAINWTIFPITQNLPGLLGGGSASRVYSARIANNGAACSITDQSGAWITSIVRPSAATCTLTVTGFTGSPICATTIDDQAGAMVARVKNSNLSTTNVEVITVNNSSNPADYNFNVVCHDPQ
jgi:hypothetical protein